ncbi:MAG: outer membrane protein assembly factor BamA [Syntrophaceae bacterium]|nr:outer membrane protein assembly factor BamA [Syntrophaceae bacterium]
MNTNKTACKIFFIFSFFIILFVPRVYSEEVKKMVVMPFEIFSNQDKAAIRESFYKNLSEELKKEKSVQIIPADEFLESFVSIDENKAIDCGKSKEADFVITGTLTQFGKSLNIDVKIIDVERQSALSPVSAYGRGVVNLSAIIGQLKVDILDRVGVIQKIASIEIQGNRKINYSAIIAKIKSKKGGILSEADIADDIKTIFKMGYFLDVTAETASTPEGKVITFTVQEKGLVSDISIIGNKALSKDDIQEILTIKTKQSLNQEQIKADIEKIKALYDSKGYYNAEIKDRVEQDGEKDFRVILDIKENDRLYIRTITFEGNEAYRSKELKKIMSTSEKGFFSFITDSGLLKRDQLKQDVGKINAYYLNNGFIDAQVADPEITTDEKGVYVKIKIQEGKRFKVGKVEISGDLLEKSREELSKSLKVKRGDDYSREAIIRDLDQLTQACNDEGYANANVNPKIDRKENEQLVDVDFQINKGEPIYISHINIFGNTITRDKVIRRQLNVAEGDLYSSSKLKSSYAKLNRLRYFEEVDFQTEKGTDENTTDINIRVKEKSTGMFMLGAGYSASDKFIGMAQIIQQNFLGYGQILSLRASLGSQMNNYDLSFTEPWLFDLPLWCKVDIWKYLREYDYYKVDSQGTGLTFGYPLFERVVGYLGYKYYTDDIKDISSLATDYVKEQEGKTVTSAATLSFIRDTTDDYIFPSMGTKTNLSVTHAGGPLGGDAYYTQYGASLFTYFPLFFDVVFAAKGRIGYIQGYDEIKIERKMEKLIPVANRYVLGGINSLRGFRYVGPTNGGTSDVIGGTNMLIFNFELILPFIKDSGMKLVVFYDAGNSWDGKYDVGDLRKSFGGGIRWYSPIGPLRLEYGRILDRGDLNDTSSGRWEFTIGMPM